MTSVILCDLAKFPTTWSVARPLCDSWACCYYCPVEMCEVILVSITSWPLTLHAVVCNIAYVAFPICQVTCVELVPVIANIQL